MSDGQGFRPTKGTTPQGPGTTPTSRPSGTRPQRGRGTNRGRSADRRRAFRSVLTCASPHARTHAREVIVVLMAVPPLPSRCASWRAVCVTSVYLMSAHATRAAATLLVIATTTSRVRTSARKCGRPCCCCGCGLRRSPDAGVAREMARSSRDTRAAMGVHARLGAAPRAARNWGLVRPLLPAWPGAPAVVVLAFLTRPTGGTAGEWPSKSPNFHTSHHTYDLPRHRRTASGPPPATQPPQGGLGPEFSQYRPICTPSLPRHPRAPPARAAHPRRPLALPVRAARSRSPLAPSARAATIPHRRQTLMVSLDFPIPPHLHTPPFVPPACAAARSARPREAGEHERGAGHRASRGDFTQALRSADTAPFR